MGGTRSKASLRSLVVGLSAEDAVIFWDRIVLDLLLDAVGDRGFSAMVSSTEGTGLEIHCLWSASNVRVLLKL